MFFAGLDAMRKIRKIRRGGFCKLSVAQISTLIVNMPDAKKNLPPEQFTRIEGLFLLYQQKTKKHRYNLEQYLEKAADIIARFNAFAPYEQYSGAGEAESLLLVQSLGWFDKQKYLDDIQKKSEELAALNDCIAQLEDTLMTARRALSDCPPKYEMTRLASRGELPQDVLDAYESLLQTVSCTPLMIENTRQRLSVVRSEATHLLTGC